MLLPCQGLNAERRLINKALSHLILSFLNKVLTWFWWPLVCILSERHGVCQQCGFLTPLWWLVDAELQNI